MISGDWPDIAGTYAIDHAGGGVGSTPLALFEFWNWVGRRYYMDAASFSTDIGGSFRGAGSRVDR
jgi:hypothetical protein